VSGETHPIEKGREEKRQGKKRGQERIGREEGVKLNFP
jgi:hypothetical protein